MRSRPRGVVEQTPRPPWDRTGAGRGVGTPAAPAVRRSGRGSTVAPVTPRDARPQPPQVPSSEAELPGRSGPGATVEIDPRTVRNARCLYTPERDGEPDPGEIVWTWVPYEENDGRGKDRPVRVVAHEDGPYLLALQLTSQRRDNDHEWFSLGSGPWDRQGRESWVDLDRVLRIHPEGTRREASALDRARFQAVVHRLQQRYSWR